MHFLREIPFVDSISFFSACSLCISCQAGNRRVKGSRYLGVSSLGPLMPSHCSLITQTCDPPPRQQRCCQVKIQIQPASTRIRRKRPHRTSSVDLSSVFILTFCRCCIPRISEYCTLVAFTTLLYCNMTCHHDQHALYHMNTWSFCRAMSR